MQRLLNVLIILLAVPVTIIASVCILVYFVFLWTRSLWITESETADEPYHLELELIKNDHLKLSLVEDEYDAVLFSLNEEWNREVYREQTCLYRVKAIPAIPALENQVCCFYCKEQLEGTIIQLLDNTAHSLYGQLNTTLILIQYPGLEVTYIDDAGPFFLYNDEKDPGLIRGFNEKEKIEIELVKN